jgi:hypothetical protein
MVYIRIGCWRFRCRRLAGGPNSWWVVARAFVHRERVVAMLLVHVFEAVPDQKDIGGAIRHVNAHRSLAQVAVLDQNDLSRAVDYDLRVARATVPAKDCAYLERPREIARVASGIVGRNHPFVNRFRFDRDAVAVSRQ